MFRTSCVVLHAAQATVRSSDLLLRDLWPAEWEPEDVVEVGGDVHVEAARQVPGLDDPVVVQPKSLPLLKVAHELGDLRLEVVGHRQPVRRRRPDVGKYLQLFYRVTLVVWWSVGMNSHPVTMNDTATLIQPKVSKYF